MQYHHEDDDAPIPLRLLIGYGLPAIVTSFPLVPFAVYLPTYFAEEMGLGFLAVGIALFLSRLVDVVSDPIVGYFSDRYSFLGEKRKGWMVIGALVSGVAIWMITNPDETVSVWYLGGWSALLYVGWTMIMVPYIALAADLAHNDQHTTKLTFAREIFSLMGTLLAVSIPLVLSGSIIELLPMVVIPIGLISFSVLWFLVPESVSNKFSKKIKSSDIKAIIKRPFTRRLYQVWFLTSVASAVPAALFPLYISTVLVGSNTEQASLIFIYFLAAIIGMPFFVKLSRTRPKNRVMAFGMLAVCLVFPAATLLSAGDILAFGIICVLTGFALAAELFLGPSMLTDATIMHKVETNNDLAAMHSALWGVISKVAFAVAILIAFGSLHAAQQLFSGSAYVLAVAALYAGLPVLLKLPAVALLVKGPFTQQLSDPLTPQIRR